MIIRICGKRTVQDAHQEHGSMEETNKTISSATAGGKGKLHTLTTNNEEQTACAAIIGSGDMGARRRRRRRRWRTIRKRGKKSSKFCPRKR
jgi:hypothetical protein